jgi:hypothetical protein
LQIGAPPHAVRICQNQHRRPYEDLEMFCFRVGSSSPYRDSERGPVFKSSPRNQFGYRSIQTRSSEQPGAFRAPGFVSWPHRIVFKSEDAWNAPRKVRRQRWSLVDGEPFHTGKYVIVQPAIRALATRYRACSRITGLTFVAMRPEMRTCKCSSTLRPPEITPANADTPAAICLYSVCAANSLRIPSADVLSYCATITVSFLRF